MNRLDNPQMGFHYSQIFDLRLDGKLIRGYLACGHSFVTSSSRTDLFDSKVRGIPCHCWDCDHEAYMARNDGSDLTSES